MNKKESIIMAIKRAICHIEHTHQEPHSKNIILNDLNSSLDLLSQSDETDFEKWWDENKDELSVDKDKALKIWMVARGHDA